MTDYAVTPNKLYDLNFQINEAGLAIEAVSNALGDLQAVQPLTPAQNVAFQKAVQANKAVSAAFGACQKWHDSVESGPTCGNDPGPGPTGPTGPGSSPAVPNPFPANKVRQYWGPASPNVWQATVAAGPGVFEASVSSGSNYYKAMVNGVLVVDGPTLYLNVMANDLIEFMFTVGGPNSMNGSLG